jgi:hypothetical protein
MAEPDKSERPPHLPHGRWLGDLGDLSPFEKRLVAACALGEVCSPDNWDDKRPESDAATEANTIRADLIRFLALGGDSKHPVHEEGVILSGGWIEGVLNLSYGMLSFRLNLQKCYFDSTPVFMAASLPELALIGSSMPGMIADGMIVKGDVFLREGFIASGEIRLLGAQIGGDLSFTRGKFYNPKGKALNAFSITVKGGVFLRHASIEGEILLPAAKIGTIIDDAVCWQAGGHTLDGLQYDQIVGPTDAEMRIEWLMQQHDDHIGKDFKPQPWEQLIKTLREMGHPNEAAKVAMAKQDQWRIASQQVLKTKIKPVDQNRVIQMRMAAGRWLRFSLHRLYGKLAGYGYRPLWTVYWMATVCMACSLFFYVGRELGVVGPSSPLIHASAHFDSCGAQGEMGKQYWTSANCPMPPEYTTFQPFIYSLDLILPLVDLQQDSDWAPIVSNANGDALWAGRVLRWLMWFEILFGWMASLTLVAVLGRLVDKD